MSVTSIIQQISIWAVPVLLAIIIHEVAHGWVAYKLGDNTAYAQGRLTLNPVSHIDLIGTIIVPLLLLLSPAGFIFGWAKPVPVDVRNLKNPKKDMAIVAAAGPISNLLMALAWGALAKLGIFAAQSGLEAGKALILMGQAGIIINILLGVLNLIPIPPLDGSRVLSRFLPTRAYILYNKLEPYGFFILIGLLVLGVFQYLLAPPVFYIYNLILALFNLV